MKTEETLTEAPASEQVTEQAEAASVEARLQLEHRALRAEFNAKHLAKLAYEATALRNVIRLDQLEPVAREIIKGKMEAGLDFRMAIDSYILQRAADAALQAVTSARVAATARREASRVGRECGPFFDPEITEVLKAAIKSIVEEIMEAKGAAVELHKRQGALAAKMDRLKRRRETGIDALAPDAEKRLITTQQIDGMISLTAEQWQACVDASRPARQRIAQTLQRFGATLAPLLRDIYDHLLDTAPRALAPFYLDVGKARRIVGESDAANFIILLRSNPPWGRSGESSCDEADEVLKLCDAILGGRIPFKFDCTEQFDRHCATEVPDGLVVSGELIPLEAAIPKKHDGLTRSMENTDVAAHSAAHVLDDASHPMPEPEPSSQAE